VCVPVNLTLFDFSLATCYTSKGFSGRAEETLVASCF